MRILQEKRAEKTVATPVFKRLQAKDVEQFRAALEEIFATSPNGLILDLKEVEFVDSSGLGALVATFKQAKEHGGMELCHVSPNILTLLKLTHLDKIFTIHEDLKTALGDLGDDQ